MADETVEPSAEPLATSEPSAEVSADASVDHRTAIEHAYGYVETVEAAAVAAAKRVHEHGVSLLHEHSTYRSITENGVTRLEQEIGKRD